MPARMATPRNLPFRSILTPPALLPRMGPKQSQFSTFRVSSGRPAGRLTVTTIRGLTFSVAVSLRARRPCFPDGDNVPKRERQIARTGETSMRVIKAGPPLILIAASILAGPAPTSARLVAQSLPATSATSPASPSAAPQPPAASAPAIHRAEVALQRRQARRGRR